MKTDAEIKVVLDALEAMANAVAYRTVCHHDGDYSGDLDVVVNTRRNELITALREFANPDRLLAGVRLQ